MQQPSVVVKQQALGCVTQRICRSLLPVFFVLAYGTAYYRLMMFWPFAIYVLILLLLCFVFRLPVKNRRVEIVLFVISIGGIGFLYFNELTACRAFYRFYESIEIGMKETTINRLRFYRFPSGGKFGSLIKNSKFSQNGKDVWFGMDPKVEPVTQDYIHLLVVDGKVVKKEWLPD